MKQDLSILTIGVQDFQEIVRFYEETLGWKPEMKEESIAFFQVDGMRLAFYGEKALADDAGVPSKRSGFKPFTLAQLLPSIEEVDAEFKRLKEKGVKIVKEPKEAFWGGYSGYISDPEGNLWEIAFNPYMPK